MVGKVLGNRYRVLREIGSGGMAWVYLAEDIKEDQLVALKVLYPQFGEDLSYVHRFNREAKLASAMTNSHIVRVLDYGADRDIYYLIMEYIEGKDLRQVLEEKGPLSWRVALDIIDQLATALEHAHQHAVVHRDIKPQNMMLDDTGILKVLDFGIARVSTLPSLTQSGFIGSPYYVSPEQAMSEDVDIRSDIYSSGIVLYELLSGHIPFDAKSPWSIISQHIANEPARIELSDIEISENVHTLLSQMIAKDREDRFQTPTELRQAIAAVLSGQPVPDYGFDTHPVTGLQKLDMAKSLYQRALEAIEAQEWVRAADLLQQTLNFNPSYTEAAEKFGQTENKALVIASYSTAQRALRREAWGEAVRNLQAIIDVEPNYKNAAALLEEAKQSQERNKVKKRIAAKYAEGISYFESERWDEAVEALQEVQRLSPGYKKTQQLLADTERRSNPTVGQKISDTIPQEPWVRWVAIAIGVIAILVLSFTFGVGSFANDQNENIKVIYEAALQASDNDNIQEALRLFDEVLALDPNYADVADRRRELLANLTPTPTPEPSPITVENSLATQLGDAQEAIDLQQWSQAIETLQDIRSTDTNFEKLRVSALLCDAYVGRGVEIIANIDQATDEQEVVRQALSDFEAGIDECPRRIDLQDQAERAAAYLEILNTPASDYDTLIQRLTPIVAVEPNYADRKAKNRLYEAYLSRGRIRRTNDNVVGSLSDYEAALALNVNDPSEAQTSRADLLISLQQPTPSPTSQETQQVSPPVTPDPPEEENDPIAALPTPQVGEKFEKPNLMTPENDAFFAGRLTEVFVEWEPVGQLAADEYYDLTIMHIFAEQPQYTGFATQETRFQLKPQDIGFSRAGGDRFYWWVTVRKANSAPTEGGLDLPLSPQSDAATFIWTP